MWITIVVVVGTVMLALLCALYCQCGDRIYTAGNNNRRNEQEPLIVEGKPIPAAVRVSDHSTAIGAGPVSVA